MSMNGFLCAFSQTQMDAMDADNDLVNQYVDDDLYAFAGNVETAWDILTQILDGAVFNAGWQVEDVISFGATLLSSDHVKAETLKLNRYSHEQVLAAFRTLEIDEDDEPYRLSNYREDENYLLTQFDSLRSFFRKAAEQNLGAVVYIA